MGLIGASEMQFLQKKRGTFSFPLVPTLMMRSWSHSGLQWSYLPGLLSSFGVPLWNPAFFFLSIRSSSVNCNIVLCDAQIILTLVNGIPSISLLCPFGETSFKHWECSCFLQWLNCPRLNLYIPCPGPAISHFSGLFLVGNCIKDQMWVLKVLIATEGCDGF